MRLEIRHTTTFSYDEPIPYALQRLRATPRCGPTQTVLEWENQVEGAKNEVSFRDHFGNDVTLYRVDEDTQEITVTSQGVVETEDRAGVIGPHRGYAPLFLFRRQTARTRAGDGVRAIVGALGQTAGEPDLATLHELSRIVLDRVGYEVGRTDVSVTAEEVVARGRGVCQDHAHVFVSAARAMGVPARYVSGYLLMDVQTEHEDQDASHAWSEAFVPHLGWVGFDVSNQVCPDDRYVRVAAGLDYADAAPISGLRLGHAKETLRVAVRVAQRQTQSQ